MATKKCDTSWPLVNVIICHNVGAGGGKGVGLVAGR